MRALQELLLRVIPQHADQIRFEKIEAENGCEVCEIDGTDGQIILRGSSTSAMTLALGQYLKHTADVSLSWCGSDLTLPKQLPAPVFTRRIIEQKYRVYMNYCTFNYSASWWNYDRWEKEIDLMALSGINMPLCAVGIEGIWYYTLTDMGFTDEEARTFISGPAFLAWQAMGNLETFGGKVSRAWIDQRIELGKKIIDRAVSLGMTPIQQGFAGCIPTMIAKKFPESRINFKGRWCGMSPTAQLDPTDPLFAVLGGKFMEIQARLFGLHGFYAADPFHESAPPVVGIEYLHEVGHAIEKLYTDADPSYVWVMMTWSLRKNIIEVLPKKKILLLDLNGASYKHPSYENFWGFPCVVGTLHNFGGRINLHGNIQRLADNVFMTARADGANAVGSGLFMEGIGQNPMFYDLAFDMLTRNDTIDPAEWLRGYVRRRYKTTDERALRAWQLMHEHVYKEEPAAALEKSSMICARPAVKIKKSGPNDGFFYPYDNAVLAQVIKLLLEADCRTDGWKYDLTDITRQYISNTSYTLYQKVSAAFIDRDAERFAQLSEDFLTLLTDLDNLLAHRDEFSFKKWVTDARACAALEEEQDLFEYNASALVTIWGEDETSVIFDYSWREWADLIGQYYKMRWQFFFDRLKGYLERGEEYSEDNLPMVHGREAWHANALYTDMAAEEVKWIHARKTFPERSPGTLEDCVRTLTEKYPPAYQ